MGIPILAPFTTGKPVKTRFKRQFGAFDITSFDLPHNGVYNSGFLIKVEGQTILYMTDFEYCPYTFKKQNINHMLIECNYQNEYVDNSAENKNHVLRGHAELQTTIGIIKDNIDSLKTVILCHLSRENANPIEMIEEVKKVVKSDVYVDYARRGFDVDMP